MGTPVSDVSFELPSLLELLLNVRTTDSAAYMMYYMVANLHSTNLKLSDISCVLGLSDVAYALNGIGISSLSKFWVVYIVMPFVLSMFSSLRRTVSEYCIKCDSFVP